MELRANSPTGPIEQRWEKHKFEMKLVNPANKRKYEVIVVGTGLAGACGRRVAGRARLRRALLLLPGQPAPRALDRRAGRHQRRQELPERRRQRLPALLRHDQGRRLPRARGERLPAGRGVASNIIDQCVAQGVPFAREYGGAAREPLASAARRSRARSTRAARRASSCCSARTRRWSGRSARGKVKMFPRTRDARPGRGRRPGARHRHARPGDRRDRVARGRRRGPRHRRLRQRLLPLDQREGLQRHRDLARVQDAARRSRNPCYTQIHPTCIPVTGDYQSKLTLMSESLRNDGRVWVPRRRATRGAPDQIPEAERDYYLERKYPSFGNLVPRDIASRAAKEVCDEGRGVGPSGRGVYLDFADAIKRLGEPVIAREVRQPLRHVRAHHGREPLQGPDAHLPGRRTTRWAGSGWTTT